MTLFLIIFKQEQNAISCKPASPRRVSFCRFVRVRFIEEEHQAQNALCCIPVALRRVSFSRFVRVRLIEKKMYPDAKMSIINYISKANLAKRNMLHNFSSEKGILLQFRESKVYRRRKSGTKRIMLYPGISKKGIFLAVS